MPAHGEFMDTSKPYRANVGIALFNAQGRVLIARRFKHDGPEIILPGHEWQMPQGGIDAHEDPRPAAERELYEETGVTSIAYLGETADWLTYEFPPYDGPPHRLSVFRGQRQKWFAFRFTGTDADIAIDNAHAEFSAWKWTPMATLPQLIVPFKRRLYSELVNEFGHLAERINEKGRRHG